MSAYAEERDGASKERVLTPCAHPARVLLAWLSPVPTEDSIPCVSPAGSGRSSWSGTQPATAPCSCPTSLPTSTASTTWCKSSVPPPCSQGITGWRRTERCPPRDGVSRKGCPWVSQGQAGATAGVQVDQGDVPAPWLRAGQSSFVSPHAAGVPRGAPAL